MITQQVVNYIKEQLSRGIARDKIRSNLASAGWLEEDINQAFTFAEPNLPNATLKIAPAFAVENEIPKETPVDKSSVLKQNSEYIPILKKDTPEINTQPSASVNEIRPVMPVETVPVTNTNLENINSRVLPEIKNTATPGSVFNNPALVDTVQKTVMSPAVNAMPSSVGSSSIQVDTVRTLNSNMATPVKETSSFLKFIAVLLFFILLIGNVYIWVFALPNMNQNPLTKEIPIEESSQIVREVDLTITPENINVLPIDTVSGDFAVPSLELQSAATNFFTKYNSYGGTAMSMGSCNASGTVFVDPAVQSSLNKLSGLTGRVPQCALMADNNPSLQNTRTVGYVIYIPMESGGHCIDSTGASIKVSNLPTGSSCVAES